MERHRGNEAPFGDPPQQGRRLIGRRAELGAEVIGRPGHGQVQADGDFGSGVDPGGQKLLEFAPAIDRIGPHTEFLCQADLCSRADRVVVVKRGTGRDRADRPHLGRRGDIERRETRRHKVLEHLERVVGLDRIGHQPGKTRLKAFRGPVQNIRREE